MVDAFISMILTKETMSQNEKKINENNLLNHIVIKYESIFQFIAVP